MPGYWLDNGNSPLTEFAAMPHGAVYTAPGCPHSQKARPPVPADPGGSGSVSRGRLLKWLTATGQWLEIEVNLKDIDGARALSPASVPRGLSLVQRPAVRNAQRSAPFLACSAIALAPNVRADRRTT
jgi:hypothetical protein